MVSALSHLARFLVNSDDPNDVMWHSLTYVETTAVRHFVAAKYSPATANRYLSALRGVLRQAWRLGIMSTDAYHRSIALEPVRGSREKAGRALTQDELAKLFGSCDGSILGRRNAALLTVLYGCGLRRAEAVALDIDDVADNVVRVRRGKGNKARTTYLPPGGRERLDAYLEVRGREPGPLFYASLGGRPDGVKLFVARRMSRDNVRLVLRAMARRAGVATFAPHDTRRSFISSLLRLGVDLVTVQGLAGHSNVQTTASYDRRPAEEREAAVQRLRIPA